MQYQIIGTRRETGEFIETTIDAPDLRAAELQAGELGILITRITDLTAPPAPSSLPPDVNYEVANIASLLQGLSTLCFVLTAVFGLAFIVMIGIPRWTPVVALPFLWIAFNMLIAAALTRGLSLALKALRYAGQHSKK